MRSWLSSLKAQGGETFGEPEEWVIEYPFEMVKTGFWLWYMSGFSRLPNQDEIGSYDPRWIGDMKLMSWLYSHQNNESPIAKMVDAYEKFNRDPDAYKREQAIKKQRDKDAGIRPNS